MIKKMNERQLEILRLLKSLPEEESDGIFPATKENIESFKKMAQAQGVHFEVIDELTDLYTVADSYAFNVILGFYSFVDDVIYEWWNDNILWIGQRDFNTLRWANGKYCLGDAGSISYSKENEYDTLVDLIKGCIKEINDLEQ